MRVAPAPAVSNWRHAHVGCAVQWALSLRSAHTGHVSSLDTLAQLVATSSACDFQTAQGCKPTALWSNVRVVLVVVTKEHPSPKSSAIYLSVVIHTEHFCAQRTSCDFHHSVVHTGYLTLKKWGPAPFFAFPSASAVSINCYPCSQHKWFPFVCVTLGLRHLRERGILLLTQCVL